jgi:hypothetical protein
LPRASSPHTDKGIGAVSDFAATHVFPPLLRLRETVDIVQPESHTRQLNAALKSAHLLPYYRTKQVKFCLGEWGFLLALCKDVCHGVIVILSDFFHFVSLHLYPSFSLSFSR